MDLIKALNKEQLEKEVPQVQVGDTVRVHVKVKEGARERIQVFEGTVIAKKHATVSCAAPSCTICVTALVRLPRSRRSCKLYPPKKERTPADSGRFFFCQGAWIMI